MKVEHKKSQSAPSLASKPGNKYFYRTEVTNTNSVPIRIIWFEFFMMPNDCIHWHGINIKNEVLREDAFVAWYSDGKTKPKGGWLQPGETAVCDPNWHFGDKKKFQKAKWSFIAVDTKGNTYFSEAIVKRVHVQFYKEK